MLGVLGAFVLSLTVCTCSNNFGSPVDCAYNVWSPWRVHTSGSYEIRTRQITRQAQNGQDENGGQACTGMTEEYRKLGAKTQVGPAEFIGNILAGNAPSYSLGGGKRYTLSRDIVLVLDNTVDSAVFPYYKSFISNIVGKFCGDIGDRPQDIRLNVAKLGSSAVQIHSFTDDQNRGLIQNKILNIRKEFHSQANLKAMADYARPVLSNEQSGTRRYNNATKEVLFVTSDRGYCSDAFVRSAAELKTTAEVYVIVLGRGTAQESCLKTLASTPVEYHFLRLEGIAEITEHSAVLLSSVNPFCFSSSSSSRNQ